MTNDQKGIPVLLIMDEPIRDTVVMEALIVATIGAGRTVCIASFGGVIMPLTDKGNFPEDTFVLSMMKLCQDQLKLTEIALKSIAISIPRVTHEFSFLKNAQNLRTQKVPKKRHIRIGNRMCIVSS